LWVCYLLNARGLCGLPYGGIFCILGFIVL
jgi:hypothetical protein